MTKLDNEEVEVRIFKGGEIGNRRVKLAAFLHKHLDEFGDPLEDIEACLDYVVDPDRGGQIILATQGDEIIGAVVLNRTGMSGYIPEQILVYIAVHQNVRGKGLGGRLMRKAMNGSEGSIALHVEPHNPARRLYERLGFENKYLEMRYVQPANSQ